MLSESMEVCRWKCNELLNSQNNLQEERMYQRSRDTWQTGEKAGVIKVSQKAKRQCSGEHALNKECTRNTQPRLIWQRYTTGPNNSTVVETYLEERVQHGCPTNGSKDCHGRCYTRRPNDSVLSTSSYLTDNLLPQACPKMPYTSSSMWTPCHAFHLVCKYTKLLLHHLFMKDSEDFNV